MTTRAPSAVTTSTNGKPSPSALAERPLLPERMASQPFGVGEDGKPIRSVHGTAIQTNLTYALACVEARARREAPSSLIASERNAYADKALQAAQA